MISFYSQDPGKDRTNHGTPRFRMTYRYKSQGFAVAFKALQVLWKGLFCFLSMFSTHMGLPPLSAHKEPTGTDILYLLIPSFFSSRTLFLL